MNSFKKFPLVAIGMIGLLLLNTGCNKKLEEKPYTVFTPEYFKTISGFQSAVHALYSGQRFMYGPEGAVAVTQAGTDEFTAADQTRTGAAGDLLTICNYTIDPGNGAILTPWNRSFNNINLANAVVEFAPDVPLDAATKNVLVAEARFHRGLYYMNLVTQFGAVPLDLGSGELKFNQRAFQGFNRAPINELLVKNYQTIINDFTFATENLPNQRPNNAFRLSKSAAFLMLSRAYMYKAYSEAKEATDFSRSYAAAMQLINNQSLYGIELLQNFADVHRENNDYNREILFSVERLPGDNNSNEATLNQGIGGGKGVDASNDFNPDYTTIRSPLPSSPSAPASTRTSQYGRPIRRFAPTAWLYNVAFADKTNDSRYDGSFRTVWLATTAVGPFAVGDTAFILAKTNAQADSMNAIPKSYRVIAPREFYLIGGTFANNIYPALSKYEDSKKQNPNDPGGRPFVAAKFSEAYLLAAEAAMQGAGGGTAEAATLLNVLRHRAAFRPGLTTAELTARRNALTISAGQVNLDFILDERTRELCGESIRWPDLARRGKLLERVIAYNPDGAPNIKPFHVYRPIPRSHLENLTVPNPQQYQNPGY
ncbi:RagB/SusD family nutrient uptake outer membrane protein [Aridibaculum aurantiacum]|uniref:RagB/SusD family nutrient uptake outer membrane protein n=1 Tax=Aridibaculum aurantiacum TaxID=2810307 RepID=UPI001A9749B6|nr:RagB/SusD family nutrient uptake outer membrane protein [Aridibaculum aurantiacum]